MRSIKDKARIWACLLTAVLILCANVADALNITFAWDSSATWPAGTTVELEANGASADGISGTQYTLDVPVQPGEVISARARSIPPSGYQCGEPLALCPPSPWTTSLVQTIPPNPSGLWATKEIGGGGMTIARRGSTNYSVQWQNSSSAEITKESTVQIGDIILVGVSGFSDNGYDTGGNVTITGGFTKLIEESYGVYGDDGASTGTIFIK